MPLAGIRHSRWHISLLWNAASNEPFVHLVWVYFREGVRGRSLQSMLGIIYPDIAGCLQALSVNNIKLHCACWNDTRRLGRVPQAHRMKSEGIMSPRGSEVSPRIGRSYGKVLGLNVRVEAPAPFARTQRLQIFMAICNVGTLQFWKTTVPSVLLTSNSCNFYRDLLNLAAIHRLATESNTKAGCIGIWPLTFQKVRPFYVCFLVRVWAEISLQRPSIKCNLKPIPRTKETSPLCCNDQRSNRKGSSCSRLGSDLSQHRPSCPYISLPSSHATACRPPNRRPSYIS